ncbi:MAG: folate-binding protein YgfZ [Burkholderiales bacterium]|nr:folate-binding protein YgfZ [Burkholderiales bacterium]
MSDSLDPSLRAGGALALAGEWGLIRALGADAATFLQGQLTNDVARLGPGAACLAGYCSAKGRLLASFVVVRPAADEFLLACSADLLPATLKRLSMFVLRAKCRLSDASAERAPWGLAGATAADWLGGAMPAAAWQVAAHGGGHAIRLPDAPVAPVAPVAPDAPGVPRLLWLAAPDAAPPPLPALSADAWAWLEVHSGIARIVGATVDQFVPQMVNFELTAGVDFHKGCYPGQEVVARSQYRGTLKRRMHLFTSSAPLAPGEEIFHSDDPGQPAGSVVLAASHAGRHAALVSLKTAALDHGTLQAGAGQAVLTPRPLPYAVPNLAEA